MSRVDQFIVGEHKDLDFGELSGGQKDYEGRTRSKGGNVRRTLTDRHQLFIT